MIKTYDVGSMPLDGDPKKFKDGLSNIFSDSSKKYSSRFEKKIVESFLDKLDTGLEYPNYPQFRDMNKMFINMIDGVVRTKNGYVETKIPSIKNDEARIPEIYAIIKNSKEIYEENKGKFYMKICITGPYTLSSSFAYKDSQIFHRLGNVIINIIDKNIFDNKYGAVKILAIDEPIFGILDDPQIDHGSIARENLVKIWENICQKAHQKGVETSFHVHSTIDNLIWQVSTLRIIESHLDDPIYFSKKTKKLLDLNDKFLKASICITDFNRLIEMKLLSNNRNGNNNTINDKIREVWTKIRKREINPNNFIEDHNIMKKRLVKIIEKFGSERIPYAGPECGMLSFPTYKSAINCLNRVVSSSK